MMDSHKQLFPLLSLFLILYLSGQTVLQAEARHHRPTRLFVFGDSYADTGNIRKGVANSWKDPYGITFPGKPAGRFSDGRVLTDYIAKYLKVKSPIPYRLRKMMPHHLKYGMNFAFGGTGVFNTLVSLPNMTTQINFLQQLIKDKVYNALDLSKSVALVSVAGNDYSHYLQTNGSVEGFPSFVASVVNQTATNLIRIKGLGVEKIVVGALQPLGCLPQVTVSTTFQSCNATSNALVLLHNTLLNQAVTGLNQETKDRSAFLILNLYDSFLSVLNHPSTHNIRNKLKPCCVGVSSEYSCGSVDNNNNVKKYRVCDDPKSAFFWDLVHPTQAGWHAVYNKLRTMNALQQIHY
ncbi:GDSL esterase/lipase [Spatholobus suberectus]|nr:GDSL esterase/lipase [Spatholobus suberectus]